MVLGIEEMDDGEQEALAVPPELPGCWCHRRQARPGGNFKAVAMGQGLSIRSFAGRHKRWVRQGQLSWAQIPGRSGADGDQALATNTELPNGLYHPGAPLPEEFDELLSQARGGR